MLGERLAVIHLEIGGEPTWAPPADLSPATDLERAAAAALGPDDWRYWVTKGWLNVWRD